MSWGTNTPAGGGFTSTATQIPFGGSGTALTSSAKFTWHDTNVTLGLAGADADIIVNATTGNAKIALQKDGTEWLGIRTGSSGLNFDFLSSGSASNFTVPGGGY
jgi:hypothetical protein